jgi:hypothetical protein
MARPRGEYLPKHTSSLRWQTGSSGPIGAKGHFAGLANLIAGKKKPCAVSNTAQGRDFHNEHNQPHAEGQVVPCH